LEPAGDAPIQCSYPSEEDIEVLEPSEPDPCWPLFVERLSSRYAGKVQRVISGAIGLDAWEWGITLFASDPLEFKKLVTDMRFDEVSAEYAEFGPFYVGRLCGAEEWIETLS
jgi:hypothetical protein